MRRVAITHLRPGMTVAQDVLNDRNVNIVSKETILTNDTIKNLENNHIISILIKEDVVNLDDNTFDDGLIEFADLYSERLRNSEEFKVFKQDFEEATGGLKTAFNRIITENAPPDEQQINKLVKDITRMAKTTSQTFDMMHLLRDYDDATFVHSMNVGLMANILGKWLKLNEQDMETLTVAGLMHDIGKLKISNDIITKPGRLTDAEYDIVKKHPVEGYQLLRNMPINEHVKNACLFHHERHDGGRYPFKLSGDKLDPFAEIVAIADVYDAMTAARCYRGPMCPFEAINIMEKEGLQKYNPKFILTFLENVVNMYINKDVMLSTGDTGQVIFINKMCISKPLVKTNNGIIDLTKRTDITIKEVI